MQVANIVAPLLFVLYLLPSGGVLMSSSSMPIIWRWIEYISFVRYGFAALVINEFHGLRFDCPPDAPMCVEDGLRYAESQGFFADDLWKYIGASAGSMGIYLLAGYVALVALRTRETK
ncbi:ATP-binding cassette protein [Trypanosoma grayi]|uniref:ATP-binding cassette protein n=1 Tax=Trypanosoma grayi TaxID=71804 RepID=UPI0004F4B6C0|nr:ATP-binding cassette protein [Trypanosoma grayi]KEG09087.1 ATP-binding cassette protein [Trypanosoma grayi]